MEITNTMTDQTPFASGFGMPTGGQSCFDVFAVERATSIRTSGLVISETNGADVRDRKDLAAKGHVALVAYVPGYPAWSPPIC